MSNLTAPRVSRFRGILLGTFEDYSPDQPERTWQLSDGQVVLPCLIPSSGLLYSLLSRPLESNWFQLADWSSHDDGAVCPLPILIAAIVPAFMHFFGVLVQVHLEAKRLGIRGLRKEELPNALAVLRAGWLSMLPLLLLVLRPVI